MRQPLSFRLTLWHALRRTPYVNLDGIGPKEEDCSPGGSAILAAEITKTLFIRVQYQVADFVQIETGNETMLREIANFGVDFRKRHRVYIREIV